MATLKNPAHYSNQFSVLAQGLLAFNRFTFDLTASYAAGAATDETLIVIGYIPVDCVMVPHLSRLAMPQMDSHGSPTGDWEVGIASNTDALLGTTAAETAAAVTFGEDWLRPAEVIGSRTEETPILVRVSNVIATLGTGSIVFEPCFRAWNPLIDG
jgi:hypothetical protein